MALLDSNTFIYAGRNCRTLGLMIAYFDGDTSVENDTGLNIDLVSSDMNMMRHRVNLYGGIYQDVLKFTFGIIKSNRSDLSRDESRIINNWLRGENKYHKLFFEGESNIYFNAICTEIVDITYGDHTGKRITFVTDAPFGYAGEVSVKRDVVGECNLKLYNSSDDGIYYPTIEITGNSDLVVIENITDDNKAQIDFSNLDDKSIIIDCEGSRIVDSSGRLIPAYKIGWNMDENIYWPRMLAGSNEYKITGNCSIKIRCSFPHKEGII